MMKKRFKKIVMKERMIASIFNGKSLPTVVIFCGIHGNEKAGVLASKNILKQLEKYQINLQGNLYIIGGNINALSKNIRFEDVDLNRIWSIEHINYIKFSKNGFNSEEKEQIEIYSIIKEILTSHTGPFYFLDLHTTSSATSPFITISDSINNRNFSANYPVSIVLGIEEYLDGPLLTYLNEFGHIALGFESGEHYDEQSVINCESFIWLSFINTNLLSKKTVLKYETNVNELMKLQQKHTFYEIDYQYIISENEKFKMNPGFVNFEDIRKNQKLAKSNDEDILSIMDGEIFMPLYQKLGNDGFFIITKISNFWLNTSIIVRKLRVNNFLRLLPGIKNDPDHSHVLLVDPRTAKYLAKEIFHLFGYRKQVLKDDKFHFIKRDRKISEFH